MLAFAVIMGVRSATYSLGTIRTCLFGVVVVVTALVMVLATELVGRVCVGEAGIQEEKELEAGVEVEVALKAEMAAVGVTWATIGLEGIAGAGAGLGVNSDRVKLRLGVYITALAKGGERTGVVG